MLSILVLNACGDKSASSPEESLIGLGSGVPELKSLEDSLSFHSGWLISQDLERNIFDLDMNLYLRGLAHGLNKGEQPLTEDEVNSLLEELEQRELQRIRDIHLQKAEKAKEAGIKFLEENAKRDSVTVLPSGLQYIARVNGDGRSPELNSVVKMHYRIRDVEGKEINSSYKLNKPQQFRISGLQLGLQEGLPLMKKGGNWIFYLPSELALKDEAKGSVGPGAVLVYEVELVDVMDDFDVPEDQRN